MMSVNRAIFAALFLLFLLIAQPPRWREGLVALAVAILVAIAIFVHIILSPSTNMVRRLLAVLLDLSLICYEMHLGGSLTSIFYPFILWTGFGNGLRFGLAWLIRSTIVGVCGFTLVVASTSFWQDNAGLTIGLMAGLVLLPAYAIILLRSLSAAKAQAEAAKAQAEAAKSRAEAANDAKTLFLARVSHELRTPLHAIIGTGSLLEKEVINQLHLQMCGTIMDASRSLLALIDDLLQTSAIESGQFPKHIAQMDLPGVVGEVRAIVAATARAKQLNVCVNIHPLVPLQVETDERHVREVLLNLAGNAVKFTTTGGILIAVSAPHCVLETIRLRFEVIDTGIGIPGQAHARIFEPFTQADKSTHARFGGTGLGLAICRQLIEGMGGQIGVISEPGAGSTFWFELDCGRVPASPCHTSDRADAIFGINLEHRHVAAVKSLADEMGTTLQSEPIGRGEFKRLLARSASPGGPLIIVGHGDPDLSDLITASLLTENTGDRIPALIMIGFEQAGGQDYRWLFPTIIPAIFEQRHLRAAAHIATTVIRPHGATAPKAPPSGPRQSLRVLVADDNPVNLQVVSRMLESAGHSYELVADGEAALDRLEAEHFDIALMDVNMHGIDGLEATRLFRLATMGQRYVPIVALTADATSGMAERCREAGMDRCIVKPVSVDTLLDTIDAVFRKGFEESPPPERRAATAPRNDHPAQKQLAADVPVLDREQVKSLLMLGGEDFLDEVLGELADNLKTHVLAIHTALATGDIHGFRNRAHAVASASANVGAMRVGQLASWMQHFSTEDIINQGNEKLIQLEFEMERLVTETTSNRPAGKS